MHRKQQQPMDGDGNIRGEVITLLDGRTLPCYPKPKAATPIETAWNSTRRDSTWPSVASAADLVCRNHRRKSRVLENMAFFRENQRTLRQGQGTLWSLHLRRSSGVAASIIARLLHPHPLANVQCTINNVQLVRHETNCTLYIVHCTLFLLREMKQLTSERQ